MTEYEQYWVAWLPDELTLIGGPYDGVIFHPHALQFYDVHHQLCARQDGAHELDHSPLPQGYAMLAMDALVVDGPFGPALHQMESESRWAFRGLMDAEVSYPEPVPSNLSS